MLPLLRHLSVFQILGSYNLFMVSFVEARSLHAHFFFFQRENYRTHPCFLKLQYPNPHGVMPGLLRRYTCRSHNVAIMDISEQK